MIFLEFRMYLKIFIICLFFSLINTINTIRKEFSETSQEFKSGFAKVQEGQKVIAEKVDDVSRDEYGQAGIRERAEILRNFKYGQAGIRERAEILRNFKPMEN